MNENGEWLEDRGVYDSENSYGPFACTSCGQEYDELTENKSNTIAAVMLKKCFQCKEK